MIKKLLITLFICMLSVNFLYAEKKEDNDLKDFANKVTNALNKRDFSEIYNSLSQKADLARTLYIESHKEGLKVLKQAPKESFAEMEKEFKKEFTDKMLPHYTFNDFFKLKKDTDIFNFFMNYTTLNNVITNSRSYNKLNSVKYIFKGVESFNDDNKHLNYSIEADTDKGIFTEEYSIGIKKEKGKWVIDEFAD